MVDCLAENLVDKTVEMKVVLKVDELAVDSDVMLGLRLVEK
jgi:hypothetical protein